MRGDVELRARLLLRGAGLAGMVTAAGGGLAIAGATRPWHVAVAEVSMLGGQSSRTVASLHGLPETPGGWTAAALGVVALAAGVLLALDRTPVRGRLVAGAAGGALLVVGVLALIVVPDVGAIATEATDELLRTREQLPVGIELELRSTVGAGPWWVLAGAATAIVGAASARDR